MSDKVLDSKREKFLEGNSSTSNIYLNLLNESFFKMLYVESEKTSQAIQDEIKTWIERVFTYQFDFSKIEFENVDADVNEAIKEFNFTNKMLYKHLQATRTKIRLGKSAIILRVGKDRIIPEVLEIMGVPKYKDGHLVELFGTKNSISMKNEESQITYYKFYMVKNQACLQTYLAPFDKNTKMDPSDDKKYLSTKEKSYIYKGLDYLPIEIFLANETATPEWEFVKKSIISAGDFTEQIIVEWKYIRTQFINNIQFNPENTGPTMQQRIEKKDVRVHDVFDSDGTLQSALSYLASGGITVDIAKGIIEYFEDKIRERLFIIAKTGGKNNKQTTEALNDNIDAYSYCWLRKTALSEEIARFYMKVLQMSQLYKFIKIGKLPRYLQGSVQLSRSLEILLNLNSDSGEKDNMTQEIIKKTEGENNGSQ